MTIEERPNYLRTQLRRHQQPDRRGKGRLLGQMEAVTGRHRKSPLQLLREKPCRKQRARQRGPSCNEEVCRALLVAADSLDWPCPERLTPGLQWLPRQLTE
ncbi:MAG: hypothetical protein HPY83_03135 [Anaerolineae bacterium]|nr:hypothetical protein [Anaerolineae bacterium]